MRAGLDFSPTRLEEFQKFQNSNDVMRVSAVDLPERQLKLGKLTCILLYSVLNTILVI